MIHYECCKIAKQKRQQEIADSLKNAALIAKQQKQQYDDSIITAKKRATAN